MKALNDYDEVLKALIQDKATKLDMADRREAILQAVSEHSKVRPLVKRRSLLGLGSSILGTPTGWDSDFSTVLSIEYPVGQVPPTYLEPEAWLLTSSPTALTPYHLVFPGHHIGTGERLNLEWSVPHTVGESTGTIPDGHYRAVAMLGASYACLQLAGYYSQAGDPLISLDSQNPGSKADQYMRLAREYQHRYREFFGLGPANGKDGAAVAAAGILVDIDRRDSWGNDFFAHPKRFR